MEEKKWMSVAQMGDLLGLKKTERYWLVHKHYFETKQIRGKLMVDISSFEKWYPGVPTRKEEGQVDIGPEASEDRKQYPQGLPSEKRRADAGGIQAGAGGT